MQKDKLSVISSDICPFRPKYCQSNPGEFVWHTIRIGLGVNIKFITKKVILLTFKIPRAVGNGTKDEEMVVKVGDNVLYGKYAGTEIELDGEKYLIMRQADVLAII